MRYSLFLHYPEMGESDLGSEAMAEGQRAFQVYGAALHEAGVLVDADVLQPSSITTTVSKRGGSLQIQDGPFAATKEQIGGVFTIDVPDLDTALLWAERCPAAEWGVVEVRPSAITLIDGQWGSPD